MSTKPTRVVTEADFRMPQYRNAQPEDYEFTSAGLVRKDRYKELCLKVAGLLGYGPNDTSDSEEDLYLLSFSVEEFFKRAKAAGVEPHAYDEIPQ